MVVTKMFFRIHAKVDHSVNYKIMFFFLKPRVIEVVFCSVNPSHSVDSMKMA